MTETLIEEYRVALDQFEGPLDLLLHLIRKDDLDIYDIPITFVLEQYMEYLDQAEKFDIDLAGDFLLTAAELAHIKSKLLMPDEGGEGEEEGPDPREELVRRLLEYQRYKEAAKNLAERPWLGREVFTRTAVEEAPEGEETLSADMTSLLVAFQKVLQKIPKDKVYEIQVDRVSVSEKIVALTEQLRGVERVKFQELFDLAGGKPAVVVTFLALLEMAKMRMIAVQQGESFDEIFIVSKVTEVGEMEFNES